MLQISVKILHTLFSHLFRSVPFFISSSYSEIVFIVGLSASFYIKNFCKLLHLRERALQAIHMGFQSPSYQSMITAVSINPYRGGKLLITIISRFYLSFPDFSSSPLLTPSSFSFFYTSSAFSPMFEI